MDNELSVGAMIAIELIVLSAVIGLIMLFAGMGQQFQRTILESVTDVVASSYGSDIEAICENEGTLPASTVYVVLERNSDIIQSITGYIDKKLGDGTVIRYTISDKEDLTKFFDTRVRTSLRRTEDDRYIIDIKSVE